MAPTGYDGTRVGAQQAGYDDGYYDDGYDDYYDEPEPKKNNKGFLVALIVLLLVLAGLLFFLATSMGGDDGDDVAMVDVPGVEGRPQAEAEAALTEAGLQFEVTTASSTDVPVGTVISQDPGPGDEAEEGSTVNLSVSAGPEAVPVPNVVGQPQDEAQRILQEAGFLVQQEPIEVNDAEEGTVAEQDPGANEQVAAGSTVTIRVVSGPNTVAIPDVAGQDPATATNTLVDAGFQPTRSDEANNDVPAGTVIGTNPSAGTQVEPGSSVTVIVSTGPDNVGVPNVEGAQEDAARAQLEGAGFQVQVTYTRTFDAQQDGVVVSQNPTANSEAEPGATVTLIVNQFRENENPDPTLPPFPTVPGGGNGDDGEN